MPTLLDFRRRIRSVRNTQQITRAMKFVAAAKLRRAQDSVFAARPYAQQINRVLRSAMGRVEHRAHPLMARREEERILVLVLTGDKGLCGAFNTNVLKRALEFFRQHQDRQLRILPVGRKGRDGLRKRRFDLAGEYINVTLRLDFSQARDIATRVAGMYRDRQVDAVYAIYNEFKSVLTQKLQVEKLLPIEPEMFGAEEPGEVAPAGGELPVRPRHGGTELRVDYLYEQPPEEIFGRLLERHVEAQIFRVLLESAAAEHAARMTAMDAATNNAAELIESLTLHMNKVRQAAITKEIIEVVSGAASATS